MCLLLLLWVQKLRRLYFENLCKGEVKGGTKVKRCSPTTGLFILQVTFTGAWFVRETLFHLLSSGEMNLKWFLAPSFGHPQFQRDVEKAERVSETFRSLGESGESLQNIQSSEHMIYLYGRWPPEMLSYQHSLQSHKSIIHDASKLQEILEKIGQCRTGRIVSFFDI